MRAANEPYTLKSNIIVMSHVATMFYLMITNIFGRHFNYDNFSTRWNGGNVSVLSGENLP